jgi:hypothetical protein
MASKGATETKRWLVGASGDVPERARLVVDAGDITIGIYRRPQKTLKTERSTNLPRGRRRLVSGGPSFRSNQFRCACNSIFLF